MVAIFQDVKDGDDVEKNLIAAVKVRRSELHLKPPAILDRHVLLHALGCECMANERLQATLDLTAGA